MDGTEIVHRKLPPPPDKNPNASELVTLDIIYKTLCPDITPERLSHTPDDQLLFFWCERAYLYLVKPSHRESPIIVEDEKGSIMPLGFIHQPSVVDNLDGKWEGPKRTWEVERMKAEFIAISSLPDKYPGNRLWRKKLNVSLVLFLVKRREGIAYRVAMLDYVPMRRWLKCKRERILVALG
ncbi:hypothetical protein B0H65DRAFT_218813 [Neurospora tetraspora]|uniref:Uncharacterized protein n=1 Tax=Neurospora tetraspora TaxID=94610 RepID=A0AAE0JC31_9PEZI|nr:hypothetical protein B0H65DRAFT_218813 [Neurospora tetraspora]